MGMKWFRVGDFQDILAAVWASGEYRENTYEHADDWRLTDFNARRNQGGTRVTG
jgi:hypothetical protein